MESEAWLASNSRAASAKVHRHSFVETFHITRCSVVRLPKGPGVDSRACQVTGIRRQTLERANRLAEPQTNKAQIPKNPKQSCKFTFFKCLLSQQNRFLGPQTSPTLIIVIVNAGVFSTVHASGVPKENPYNIISKKVATNIYRYNHTSTWIFQGMLNG